MTLIAWNGGPIFRNGAVGTEQACCCGDQCPPCECDWPHQYPAFLHEESENLVECANSDGLDTRGYRGQVIYPFSVFGFPGFPPTLTWKPGYPAALDARCLNLAVVFDTTAAQCCYDYGNGYQISSQGLARNRWRVMAIDCRTNSLVDLTAESLDGDNEQEFFFDEPSAEETCAELLPFFPDPEPDCNPLP